MTEERKISTEELAERFREAVSTFPADYFVDGVRPMPGEIWEDAEGVLYTVSGMVGITRDGQVSIGLYAFAVHDQVSIHREEVTKPLALAFDDKGNFMLNRPLRYPDGFAYRKKD